MNTRYMTRAMLDKACKTRLPRVSLRPRVRRSDAFPLLCALTSSPYLASFLSSLPRSRPLSLASNPFAVTKRTPSVAEASPYPPAALLFLARLRGARAGAFEILVEQLARGSSRKNRKNEESLSVFSDTRAGGGRDGGLISNGRGECEFCPIDRS